MPPIDAYLFLFCDSILAALIFTSNTEMAYLVMKIFGYYNSLYMSIIAITGNLIGSCLNYLFGFLLRTAKARTSRFPDSDRLINLSRFANKYLIYLAMFSFLSIWGVVITTAAGFLRVNFKYYAIFVIMGRILFYHYR